MARNTDPSGGYQMIIDSLNNYKQQIDPYNTMSLKDTILNILHRGQRQKKPGEPGYNPNQPEPIGLEENADGFTRMSEPATSGLNIGDDGFARSSESATPGLTISPDGFTRSTETPPIKPIAPAIPAPNPDQPDLSRYENDPLLKYLKNGRFVARKMSPELYAALENNRAKRLQTQDDEATRNWTYDPAEYTKGLSEGNYYKTIIANPKNKLSRAELLNTYRSALEWEEKNKPGTVFKYDPVAYTKMFNKNNQYLPVLLDPQMNANPDDLRRNYTLAVGWEEEQERLRLAGIKKGSDNGLGPSGLSKPSMYTPQEISAIIRSAIAQGVDRNKLQPWISAYNNATEANGIKGTTTYDQWVKQSTKNYSTPTVIPDAQKVKNYNALYHTNFKTLAQCEADYKKRKK